jgi:hypothetical protein
MKILKISACPFAPIPAVQPDMNIAFVKNEAHWKNKYVELLQQMHLLMENLNLFENES